MQIGMKSVTDSIECLQEKCEELLKKVSLFLYH